MATSCPRDNLTFEPIPTQVIHSDVTANHRGKWTVIEKRKVNGQQDCSEMSVAVRERQRESLVSTIRLVTSTTTRARVPFVEFPPRKSPYPPTSILVLVDRNEISICIRAQILLQTRNSAGKVNNDPKIALRSIDDAMRCVRRRAVSFF